MKVALADLELDRLVVFYAGSKVYEITDRVVAVPASILATPERAAALLRGD